jgi:uncharacterized membrane protein
MTDDRFERWIAYVLAAGVALSALLVGFGFVASFVAGWDGSLRGMAAPTVDATDFADLLPRLVALQPLAIVQTGLIVLILTPIARVGVTVLGFWREHDLFYVGISVIVLVMLVVSLGLLR